MCLPKELPWALLQWVQSCLYPGSDSASGPWPAVEGVLRAYHLATHFVPYFGCDIQANGEHKAKERAFLSAARLRAASDGISVANVWRACLGFRPLSLLPRARPCGL